MSALFSVAGSTSSACTKQMFRSLLAPRRIHAGDRQSSHESFAGVIRRTGINLQIMAASSKQIGPMGMAYLIVRDPNKGGELLER